MTFSEKTPYKEIAYHIKGTELQVFIREIMRIKRLKLRIFKEHFADV